VKKSSTSAFVSFSRKSASRRNARSNKRLRAAVSAGRLKGNEALPAKVTLSIAGVALAIDIEGTIELE
jgi:hypothetical protein